MIRAGLLALLVAAAEPGAEAGCPPPSDTLLFHSCWGRADARALLLPEDGPPALPEGRRSLVVTGSYTGTEARTGGRPNPVGLFVHRGQVVNPNLARMDGVLILSGRGLSLQHRAQVAFDGRRHDLRDLADRRAFLEAAARAGASVLQSHLLVVDGRVDVTPSDDAPRFARRLLFTDAHGWGVHQTEDAVTLHEAATEVLTRRGAHMALNLDMGGHDYCWLAPGDGDLRRCGFRGREDLEELSNLLVFALD